MTKYKKEIEKLVRQLSLDYVSFFNYGAINTILDASRGNEHFVIKLVSQNCSWKISKDISIMLYFKDNPLMPNYIDSGFINESEMQFLIMTRLEGRNSGIKTPRSEQFFYDVGQQLALLHQKEYEEFGFLLSMNQIASDPHFHNGFAGLYKTGLEQFWTYTKGWSNHLIDKNSRYKDKLTKILMILEHEKQNYIEVRPRLNHGDFQFENLLFNHDRLSGIVDFDLFKSGDPSYDIHTLLQNCSERGIALKYQKRFILGYKSVRNVPQEFLSNALFFRCFSSVQKIINLPLTLARLNESFSQIYKRTLDTLLGDLIENKDKYLNNLNKLF